MSITYLIPKFDRIEVVSKVSHYAEALLRSIQKTSPLAPDIALVRDGNKCLGAYISSAHMSLDPEFHKTLFHTDSKEAILFVAANEERAVCTVGCPPSKDFIEAYIRLAHIPEDSTEELPELVQGWYSTVPDVNHNAETLMAVCNILISSCIKSLLAPNTLMSKIDYAENPPVIQAAMRALCEVMGAECSGDNFSELPSQHAAAVGASMDLLLNFVNQLAKNAQQEGLSFVDRGVLQSALIPVVMQQWISVYSQMHHYLYLAEMLYSLRRGTWKRVQSVDESNPIQCYTTKKNSPTDKTVCVSYAPPSGDKVS